MPAPPNDLSQRRADFVGAVSRSGQMITLKQLQVFTAVAERQHMTQASYDLGMAQSAVSATVAPLETSLGCSLFARIGRGITLTPSGRFFLGEANAILDRIAAATCEVSWWDQPSWLLN